MAVVREWYSELHVEDLLQDQTGLRIVPTGMDGLLIRGTLQFTAAERKSETITDQYDIELFVSPGFPRVLPVVYELAGRIPADFHKLEDESLCLGAPTEVRMRMKRNPTLPAFVNGLVIPYLYGYSYCEKHGVMPFGELEHGDEGIRQYLAGLFQTSNKRYAVEFLRLASMKKRDANKLPCPCGSGRRLGRCHNRVVNQLRDQFGRKWFDAEYRRVRAHLYSRP